MGVGQDEAANGTSPSHLVDDLEILARKAKCLCSLVVDGQFEPSGLSQREVGRAPLFKASSTRWKGWPLKHGKPA